MEESFIRQIRFANSAEFSSGTASKIADISKIKWSDSAWLNAREKFVG